MWPPSTAALTISAAHASAGSSTTVTRTLIERPVSGGPHARPFDGREPDSWASYRAHLAGGVERRQVGGIPQQRLAHALTEDSTLPTRGAEDLPLALAAVDQPLGGIETALAALQRQRGSVGAGHGHAGQAGRLLVEDAQRELDLAVRAARRAVQTARRLIVQRPAHPAQPRCQPAGEQQRARVGVL